MSAPRTALVAATAWLAVVVVGSTLVWTVISRAGDVVPAAGDGLATGQASATSDPTVVRRAHRLHRAEPSHRRSSGPGTSRPSQQATPSTPASSASSAPTSPSSPGTTAPGPAGSGGSAPAGPAPQRRTWQGSGGYVSVECRGSRISLVAAQADAGFRVEVGSRGPEEVEVTFQGQGEEQRETEVHAHCAGGAPVFEVHTAND